MSATTIIVNDVEPRRQYTATSGQTVFDFPIPFFEDVDLQVYLTPAGQQSNDTADILTLTTDYSVAGANTQDSGAITLVTGASTGDIITIERVVSIARTADYQTSGDLLAETVNREQDTEIFISQQLRADINRSFRFPITDSSGASLVLPSPTANYVIGWNSDGDSITNFQEIGQYQGTDATVTTISYSVRDLVKSTSAGQLDNVYICTQASPAGTSLTNTSYWSLIVDAVSAAASATNAAASASAAATSASNASTSETNAATSETNAGNSATSAATSATNAANSASTASTAASNASTSESNASTSETNAAASAVSASSSASSASSSASSASSSATTATTKASEAATSASNAATSETNAANSASAASTSATNAATSESNAATSATNAETAYDNFDDRYLGAKASDPTLDNDGDALITGALYFNTTDDVMKVWEGSSWVAAYASLSGALIASNNLSDLGSASSALTNLGISNHDDITVDGSGKVGIGTSSPSSKLEVNGTAHLGNGVTQSAPSSSDIMTTTHTYLGGTGGNGVFIGQYPSGTSASSHASWLQASYTVPSTATYDLVLNPLGGNVGIGTSSPSALLHLSGTLPRIYLTDTDTSTQSEIIGDNGWLTLNAASSRIVFNIGGSEIIRATSSGISVTGSVTLGNWSVTQSGTDLVFATGGTNKMKLDASGNLTVVGEVTAFGTV